jgi:uncharacterized membrane protein YqjE
MRTPAAAWLPATRGCRRPGDVNVIGENTASRPGSVAAAVVEIVNEFKEFARTRYQMFRLELKENMANWGRVAMLAGLALLLLGTAWLLFSVAIAALIAAAFYPSPYAWFLGLIIVTVLWGGAGGMFALLTKRQMKVEGMYPKQTVTTLKEDQVWIQKELGNSTNGNIENPEDNSRRAA